MKFEPWTEDQKVVESTHTNIKKIIRKNRTRKREFEKKEVDKNLFIF